MRMVVIWITTEYDECIINFRKEIFENLKAGDLRGIQI
jgi:hypothetical protein